MTTLLGCYGLWALRALVCTCTLLEPYSIFYLCVCVYICVFYIFDHSFQSRAGASSVYICNSLPQQCQLTLCLVYICLLPNLPVRNQAPHLATHLLAPSRSRLLLTQLSSPVLTALHHLLPPQDPYSEHLTSYWQFFAIWVHTTIIHTQRIPTLTRCDFRSWKTPL